MPLANIMVPEFGDRDRSSAQEFVDLPMARHGGGFLRATIHPNRMPAAFSQGLTAVRRQISKQRLPLHLAEKGKSFTDDDLICQTFFGELTIGFQDKGNCFLEVLASFLKRVALGIGARKFLDEADIAFRHFLVNGRQLEDPCDFSCDSKRFSLLDVEADTLVIIHESRVRNTHKAYSLFTGPLLAFVRNRPSKELERKQQVNCY